MRPLASLPAKPNPPLTCDAAPRTKRPGRRNPVRLSRTEREYGRALKSVAWHVGDIVRAFKAGNAEVSEALSNVLRAYSDALKPWALVTAERMLQDVNKRDMDSWRSLSNSISSQLHQDLRNAPLGELMQQRLHDQVELITSLPREAAERVHKLTLEGLENSARADEIAKEILRSGEVTASRAQLIARTEVARTASELTQARAESAGSEGYIWRTVLDSSVRESHRKMEGKLCRWDTAPAVQEEDGTIRYYHPGRFPNCRCWPEAIIVDPN
jgi:SPP1 gp7 family putative phage head morphogenesis protein